MGLLKIWLTTLTKNQERLLLDLKNSKDRLKSLSILNYQHRDYQTLKLGGFLVGHALSSEFLEKGKKTKFLSMKVKP